MSLIENLFAYNTLVVLAGTMLLGVAAGITGTFLMLRGRALAGDVIGHAALPGVAVAFLVYASIAPEAGKSLPVMLIGGAISSGLAMLSVLWLRRVARLPEDAVMAIVLSTFFGIGVVLMPIVQASPTGSQAGLPGFIFGQAASIRQSDVFLLAGIAIVAILASTMLLKEWTLMCFDEGLATVLGYPVRLLDLLLMSLVVAVCVAGMQSVGLLLIVGLLIIPASAARYWSDSIRPNIWISAAIGALAAGFGSVASAIVPKLSTGAIIVVVASGLLAVSAMVGRRHGWMFK
ncbi:Manganese transport system membrane protein MntB [Rubripirellula reticaptiva]|uniref:Manganese transport system membrane protein MntB n=2 Tax=Rubripirellula reticaptiva TaxID=2528013 RepID=A0A5C6EJE6_9BACT|nr:Manganese transport system membrane protein MntB [Rubripirellula reticaptiva]